MKVHGRSIALYDAVTVRGCWSVLVYDHLCCGCFLVTQRSRIHVSVYPCIHISTYPWTLKVLSLCMPVTRQLPASSRLLFETSEDIPQQMVPHNGLHSPVDVMLSPMPGRGHLPFTEHERKNLT